MRPRVFILDNTDSFTFNLAQAFLTLGAEVRVERFSVSSSLVSSLLRLAEQWRPTHLILSPGPLRPADHPANVALLDRFAGRTPILGVCLGMQAINEWCGGRLRRDTPPMHGKTSLVRYEPGAPLFDGLPNPFTAARYHSLVVDRLGEGLLPVAWVAGDQRLSAEALASAKPSAEPGLAKEEPATSDGVIMALVHSSLPIVGVQFHPESYLTPEGNQIFANFLEGTFLNV